MATTHWLRFERTGTAEFGTLYGTEIAVHAGSMFDGPAPTGERVPLDAVRLLPPTVPSKVIGLWNNFHALAAKLGQATPPEPLYFIKAASAVAAPGAVVRRPAGYDGKVVFEGELGVVIGRTLCRASADEAAAGIFGYTCVNDITAADILNRDPSFAQWTRAKSFDGFGPFGPVVATGLAPEGLRIRTVLNGAERQDYPASDMVFPPAVLVGLLSHDMTLLPGDLVCCGTSIGVGAMREARNVVEVSIEGVGVLRTVYEN